MPQKLHSAKTVKELGHKSVETAELDQHLSTCGQGAARGLVIGCALLLALCCLHSSPVVGDLLRASVVVLSAFVCFTTGLAYWTKRASLDVEKFERARESWEAENFLEGEKQEMLELYCAKGYSHEQAAQIVEVLASNLPAFVDVMMV